MKKLFILGLLLFITGSVGMLFTGKSLFKAPAVNAQQSITTSYNNINIDVQSGDVEIKLSKDKKTHFKISGVKKKDFFKYNVKENTLNIINNQLTKNKRIFNYGFEQQNNPSIEISIPKKQYQEILLNTNKSDLDIDQLETKTIKINSKVGGIYIEKLKADQLDTRLGTGELEINTTNVKQMNFDIKLGKLSLYDMNPDINIDGNIGSGEAELYYQTAPKNTKFNVTSSSGEVKMNDVAGSKSVLGTGENHVNVKVELGTVEFDEE